VQIRPLQDLQPAVTMFGKSRAPFNPIAIVAVQTPVDRADFRAMDVAADDAVGVAPACFGNERVFVVADGLDRILDLVLEILLFNSPFDRVILASSLSLAPEVPHARATERQHGHRPS
jgi:hypothetical protein